MAEDRRPSRHSIVIEQRASCSITGVIEVISFDEETVIAETQMGVLIVHGTGLHVSRLNLEAGDLEIDGEISNVSYEEQASHSKGKPSIISKLFR